MTPLTPPHDVVALERDSSTDLWEDCTMLKLWCKEHRVLFRPAAPRKGERTGEQSPIEVTVLHSNTDSAAKPRGGALVFPLQGTICRASRDMPAITRAESSHGT
jgi:hypothetical protein